MAWTADDTERVMAALPQRIGHIIRSWAAQAPDRPALVESGATLTYNQLADAVAAARACLIDWESVPATG